MLSLKEGLVNLIYLYRESVIREIKLILNIAKLTFQCMCNCSQPS
jgi:hypothetical protein